VQAEPDIVVEAAALEAPLPGMEATEVPDWAEHPTSSEGARVPIATLVAYGLPAVALGFMGALVALYILKFATDTLLIAPAVFGSIFAIAKLWDGISDPLAGYLSDRTQTRMGRRRPWILAGALPLGLVFVALWSPPPDMEGTALTIWLGASIILFYTMFTVVAVPHMALGAELTLDYHERSRVFGSRALFDFAGFMLAAGAMGLLESADDERAMATLVSSVLAVLAVALIGLSVSSLRERAEFAGRGAHRIDHAVLDVLRNPHALLLLTVFFLDTLGFSSMMVLFPFVAEYMTPSGGGSAALYFGVVMGVAILSFPLWFPLSRRYGKRNPWIAANIVKCGVFAGMFFMDGTSAVPIWITVIAMGAVQPAGMILAPSIKADVIDYDEYKTGQRKEGAYFATWNLASKLATGIAIFVAGFALQIVGFTPDAEQTEESIMLVRSLFAGFPFILHLIGVFILFRFSLDATEHARVRAALDAAAAQRSGA
jgi:GPH family glycoside/pentoside/hexuronide:cation symporter